MKGRTIQDGILNVPRNLIRFMRIKEKKLEHDFPEIAIAIILFILVVVILITLNRLGIFLYRGPFLENFIGEVHGLGFDILVFGILLVIFNKLSEKRKDRKRWLEEIEDLRFSKNSEATLRIVGNIRRLNRIGYTQIDLSFVFLEDAQFYNWTYDAYEKKETFWKANLQGSDFQGAHLKNAFLAWADLRKTRGLTVEQLSEVMSLYKAKLDPELERELKTKSPNLFKEP